MTVSYREMTKNNTLDSFNIQMEVSKKMESEKPKGNPPNFAGDGLSVWVNKTKDNEQYLTVQLFGKNGVRVNCFKVKPRVDSK